MKIFTRSFLVSFLTFIFFFVQFVCVFSIPIYAASPYTPSNSFTNIGTGTYYEDGISPTLDAKHHRLFVTDSYNSRVLVYDLDSFNKNIDNLPDHVLGQANFDDIGGDYTSNTLYKPGQTAYDSVHDRLFVSDLYDNCRVMVFDTAEIIDGESAVNILGGSDIESYGDCGTTQSTFASRQTFGSVAYDEKTQFLYVSDTYTNCRVMVFDLSAGITDGMDARYVLGSTNFSSEGAGDQSATGIYDRYPDLLIDSNNSRLFVSLYNQKRILVFDVSEIVNGEPAAHILGQPDFTTKNSGNTIQGGGGPVGLGYDTSQKLLLVPDYENARIIVYDVKSITDGEDAVAILADSDVYPYDQANIAYDSINRQMYYGDDGNAQVLFFQFAHLKDLTNTSVGIGALLDQTLGEGYQGTTTYTFDSGSLPQGITFNSSTGLLSGRATAEGTHTFTISISDDNGTSGIYTYTKTYTLSVTSGNKPDGESSTTEAPHCTDQPANAPDLFQVDRSYSSATVHFTPLSDNVSSYLISYGTDDKAEGYSVELPISHSDGVVSQTINELNPSTSYNFKVKAQKGCMPGNWSGVKKDSISTTTDNLTSQVFTPSNQGSDTTASTTQSKSSSKKKVVKKITKSTKKIMKPKSTPTPKSTKPWYMFW